ncbi:MAG: hypothetical protein PWR06_242 [Thermoanaerobacteraceae bacterium]|nr:hypothetical protein [Thermoanaerobacteraceae bacterium]
MKPSDVLSLLGISQKARKLVSGQDSVERAIISKRVFLIIVSEDSSDNTKKRFSNMANSRNIPVVVWGNARDLGKSIGKEERKVLGLTDRSLAYEVYRRLKSLTGVGDIEQTESI